MKVKYILPIVVAVALLVGVGIMAMALPMSDNQQIREITLKENGVTTAQLEFSASGLAPADSREYTIHLTGSSAKYTLSFQFLSASVNPLKDYIEVTLQHGDDSYDYSLADLLDGTTVSMDCVVGDSGTAVVSVIYSMSADIGNEAQRANADFTINLTAEKSVS